MYYNKFCKNIMYEYTKNNNKKSMRLSCSSCFYKNINMYDIINSIINIVYYCSCFYIF